MKALGLIETKGLLAAVESADVMLKTADVSLVERTFVGGGLVSVAVTGDVAAVKAAVEAAAAAVGHLDNALLISQHVIPRPHEELENVILFPKPPCSAKEKELVSKTDEISQPEALADVESPVAAEAETEEREESPKQEITEPEISQPKGDICKEDVDKRILDHGLLNTIEFLGKFKVLKLRNLAREYKDFGIAGRLVSKADKQQLLAEFKAYYEKQ